MQYLNTHKLAAALVLAVIAALSSFYLNVWGEQAPAVSAPVEPVVVPLADDAPAGVPEVVNPVTDAPTADVPVILEVAE